LSLFINPSIIKILLHLKNKFGMTSSLDIKEEEYDFAQDDIAITKKETKKRKKPEQKKDNLESKNLKKKKKNANFDIDLEKRLDEQIQEWVDKEWNNNCEKTIGYIRRENARLLLSEAFSKSNQKTEIVIWAMEQTVYYNWFVFNYEQYARRIRSLCMFIVKNPERFLGNN